MKFRRNIASLLEGAASNLETYLPAQMRTGDAAGDAWLETTAEQIAAVIRNLNKHLAVPAEHSREMVMDRLAFNLTRLAAGDWNAMDRMPPQGVSRRRTWRGRITLAVQTTISAGIPIVVLIGIRQKWLAIPEAFTTYVTLALVVWAAVALLRAFDPFFESNLGLIEKFIPLLRGKGKD
jgi:hypothetical protein